MSNLLRLELDIAGDIGWQDASGAYTDTFDIRRITTRLESEATALGLSVALVTKCGPAGGNPLYAFTGTREQLLAYLHAHMNPGLTGTDLDEEFAHYLKSAKAV